MLGFITGAAKLIGAGASLIGATRKPKARAEGVDYQRLRDEATAAGFNPLTALMYGGAQAYQRTYGPALSRWSGVGAAMQAFSDDMFQRQIDQDRAALDREYFGLEGQRLALDERRLAVERQMIGASYGPVFGPSARVADTRYEQLHAQYGPIGAVVSGTAGYADAVGDLAVSNVKRAAGSLASGAAGWIERFNRSAVGALTHLQRLDPGAASGRDALQERMDQTPRPDIDKELSRPFWRWSF